MPRPIPDDLTDVDPIDVPTDPPDLLWCNHGQHWQPRDRFHRDRSRPSGRKGTCADCTRKIRGVADPERIPEGKRKCRSCHEIKAIGQFRWMMKSGRLGNTYGHDPLCRECRREVQRYYNRKQYAEQDPAVRNAKRREAYRKAQREKATYRKMMFSRLRYLITALKDRGLSYHAIGDAIERSSDVVNRWMIRNALPYQSTLEDVVPKLERLLTHANTTTRPNEPDTVADAADDSELISWAEWAAQRRNGKHAAD